VSPHASPPASLLVLAAAIDVALVLFVAHRLVRARQRGFSLRLRIFFALSMAMLLGALTTGVYATALDPATLGFVARLARVLPKGFLLASGLLPVLAGGAAWVGVRLARPVEELSLAATRIAEGGALRHASEDGSELHPGHGHEAVRLARALASMRRELADKPFAAAFLRDAWHDLKTPVAALSATIEVLEDGALDDPEAARRFVKNLRRSTDQLDRLLQDLVTLARFETSALRDPEPTDLTTLGQLAIDGALPLAQAKRVTLALSSANPRVDARLSVDRAALSRALANLLDNAIRASPGGRVTVELAPGGTADRVALLVTNEPAEIPIDIRDRLFRRAAVAPRVEHDSLSGAGGGSGLGLAIVRAAVEAHGGSVRFVDLGPPRVTVRIEMPR
jgi:signal transduction histidine kinase